MKIILKNEAPLFSREEKYVDRLKKMDVVFEKVKNQVSSIKTPLKLGANNDQNSYLNCQSPI